MEQKRSSSESVVLYFVGQSKTANDRESHFGLGYQKHSMESEGDDPGIGTFALIYWNHFSEAGPFLFQNKHSYCAIALDKNLRVC